MAALQPIDNAVASVARIHAQYAGRIACASGADRFKVVKGSYWWHIRIGDSVAVIRSTTEAIAQGIVYVPEDRGRQGAVKGLPIYQNITLPSLSRTSRNGFLRMAEEFKLARDYTRRLDLRAASLDQDVGLLSGGNQPGFERVPPESAAMREVLRVLARAGAPLGAVIARVLQDKDAWQGEVRLRRRSGDTYPAWLMVSAVRDGSKTGGIGNYIGICIDITDRKANEERIQYLAHHDVLTDLPNRSLCVQRLQEALAQAALGGEQVAVLFIDLDRFKIINDTLGHHIGDGLLRSVAERLKQAVRGHDTVSRLGGDEFVIVMRGVASKDEVRQTVERRLIPLIRHSHPVDGHELNVSCSVGIAVYPEDGTQLDELMRRADAAMYEAKATGRDMARFYSEETDQRALARQSARFGSSSSKRLGWTTGCTAALPPSAMFSSIGATRSTAIT